MNINPKQHIDEHVDDYLFGVLDEGDRARFEEHVETCESCQAALEAGQRRKDVLQSVPPSEATEELLKKTTQRVDGDVERRSRHWYTLLKSVGALTTAAVILIGCFHIYVASSRPTPYDVRILGQSEWLEGSYASVRVAVFDQNTGEPLSGVPVELTLVSETWGTTKLASFQTSGDTLRSPRFRVPEGYGDARLVVTAKPNGHEEVIRKSVKTKRAWKLMLSTDKPVYQPGQTIFMRAIGLRQPDLQPVAGEQVTYSLRDPKSNVVFRSRSVSSKYGISSAECQLATEIIEGDYELTVQVGATSSVRTVKIEKYVLPKFEVNIELDRPFYGPNDKVTGTVQSDYFFGEPVAQGDVKLQVFTTDVTAVLVHETTLKTDETGKSEFNFDLPSKFFGREQTGGDAEFQLFATVTDIADQQQTRAMKRRVTNKPLRVEIIPESGTLVRGVKNRIFIYTSTADGKPAQTTLKINGETEVIETNEQGLAVIERTPALPGVPTEGGDDVIVVVATDSEGRVTNETRRLGLGGTGDYLVRPNKAVYDGGETMELLGLGGGVEPIFVDLLKEGQCVLSDTIEMGGDDRDAHGELQIDLPAELCGTLQLVTYRFGRAGLPVRKSRTIFIRQANEVNIDAQLDRESYKPGEKATLTLKLTDADGKPKPGAISLAAVDEAVFSVLNQSAGVERIFFLLEKQLLEPVYTIYPWAPAELRNDRPEQQLVDRAFLSLTSAVASGRNVVPRRFTGETGDAARSAETANVSSSPFSLNAATYKQKSREFKRWQRKNLGRAQTSWVLLFVALFLTGSAIFAAYRPVAFAITAGVLVCLALPLFCLISMTPLGAKFDSVTAEASAGSWEGAEERSSFAADNMIQDMYGEPGSSEGGKQPPRLRQDFPETLLWRPEVVTDDAGEAKIEIDLADSITTWRLSASAVAAGGQLGSLEKPIRVFQPFFVEMNLPVSLTRGDEATVPLVVYNYLDEPQTVELTVEDADWFERLPTTSSNDVEERPSGPVPPEPRVAATPQTFMVTLGPQEIKSVGFPIRVLNVGQHALQVTAISPQAGDAIRRSIEVVPNGTKIEQVVSGTLANDADIQLTLPEDIVPGSAQAFVKLYPSTFSQLVEGLDSIFHQPYGCFEQTSSTTYPNVLALEYMRQNDLNQPQIEAKARQYIHLGYQRLLGFEVDGGGFDWYGSPPAKLTLTAYGLMEFQDMARVHDVDPDLISRTRSWLMNQRLGNGSWPAPNRAFGTVGRANSGGLATTAYIAWSVYSVENADGTPTLDYLLQHEPGSIDDPYLLSLVVHAIHAISPDHPSLAEYATRLSSLKQSAEDKDVVWWEPSKDERTMFYGDGRGGDCETTALAAMALLKTKHELTSVRRALTWLVSNKDNRGTWHSTQATVLALKALIAGTGQALGQEKDRRIELTWNGEGLRPMTIPLDQAEVMQMRDITSNLSAGTSSLRLSEPTKTDTAFQVVFRYYVEDIEPATEDEPLSIDIAYDRTRLKVDETVAAVATIRNKMEKAAPMVMIDLPIPGGFRIEPGELEELKGSGKIARYEITARQAIIYLLGLQPDEKLKLNYRLRATMPVNVTAPAGHVYEYYDPDVRSASETTTLKVTEA